MQAGSFIHHDLYICCMWWGKHVKCLAVRADMLLQPLLLLLLLSCRCLDLCGPD